MDERLTQLAKEYRSRLQIADNIKRNILGLYECYVKGREQGLLDAIAACGTIGLILESDRIDYSAITPQMERAFELAFPGKEVESLSDCTREQLSGYVNAWKGKYFEVLVEESLNSSDWVGDIHLEPGQYAQLADSATQPGWDLQIFDSDGSVAQELQMKATESLGKVITALDKYPDIKIVATNDLAEVTGDYSDMISDTDWSDAYLTDRILAPMAALFDSPMEEFIENILPGLPFVIIACTEGGFVLTGRKTLGLAVSGFLERSVKSSAALGVAAAVIWLDGGWLSVPVALLSRLVFDRCRILRRVEMMLDEQMNAIRGLQESYPALIEI